MTIFGKLWTWFVGYLSEKVPAETKLQADLEGMLKGLDAKADAVSFSMARAEDAQEKLRLEVENHDALELQATQFMTDGDEEAAQRLVTLQLQSRKEIERLATEYQTLLQEAERNVEVYQKLKAEVDKRRRELPRLQDESRIIKAEEEFQRISGRFSLTSAQGSFDETARQIRMKKLQVQNKQLLDADPHAELDKRIERTLQGKELETAMRELRQKVGRGIQTVIVEDVDAVSSARKLLEAPRIVLALPSFKQKALERNRKE
jgi:phage shock protein A